MQSFEQVPETYQIESFITNHKQVIDAKVITIPHPEHNELIVAWVIREDQSVNEQDLIQYCQQSNEIKSPDHVLFTDEFPTTPSGKIQKIRLKEIALEQLNR
ncbi:AMP-binding enzyme [Alkalibacillus silvisoli]|uniref:AMP-binding enzyme C-terminal domain-containing protein n=1 Tax=Alkalibacillus silvisoli TaxID=392823 RepID=A0ABN0ZXF4_9BACI